MSFCFVLCLCAGRVLLLAISLCSAYPPCTYLRFFVVVMACGAVLGIPSLENRKATKIPFHFVLIDITFIFKIWESLYGDLHHFPVPVFENSNCQKSRISKCLKSTHQTVRCADLPFVQKNRYSDMKHNMFKDVLIFPCIFLKYFRDKYRVRGFKFSRLFGSSRNHPKSIAICSGVKISHSGIIKTPQTL